MERVWKFSITLRVTGWPAHSGLYGAGAQPQGFAHATQGLLSYIPSPQAHRDQMASQSSEQAFSAVPLKLKFSLSSAPPTVGDAS